MNKELRITIAGTKGSGKSTILYLILRLLKSYGVAVEFIDDGITTESELENSIFPDKIPECLENTSIRLLTFNIKQ